MLNTLWRQEGHIALLTDMKEQRCIGSVQYCQMVNCTDLKSVLSKCSSHQLFMAIAPTDPDSWSKASFTADHNPLGCITVLFWGGGTKQWRRCVGQHNVGVDRHAAAVHFPTKTLICTLVLNATINFKVLLHVSIFPITKVIYTSACW